MDLTHSLFLVDSLGVRDSTRAEVAGNVPSERESIPATFKPGAIPDSEATVRRLSAFFQPVPRTRVRVSGGYDATCFPRP